MIIHGLLYAVSGLEVVLIDRGFMKLSAWQLRELGVGDGELGEETVWERESESESEGGKFLCLYNIPC